MLFIRSLCVFAQGIRSSELAAHVSALCDGIFARFLDFVASKENSAAKLKQLEENAKFLLVR